MPALSANALQLHRLLQLRWAEIAGQFLAILVAVKGLGLPLNQEGLYAVCLVLAAVNLFSHWRLLQPWPVPRGELLAQLCVDVAALALLLYQSGGGNNPFSSLLLVPMTIAATLLPPAWVWLMALVTATTYSCLLLWHVPLPTPNQPLEVLNDLVCTVTGVDRSLIGHDNGFALHVAGMWINFLVSVLVVAAFVSRLAAVLRARDRELARAREQTLRQEKVLALGTLAAGAAHQLGTPLSTMAVVLHELQLERDGDPALASDLALMRGQVDLCKAILAGIVARAGKLSAVRAPACPLDDFLARVLDQWRLLRPDVAVFFHAASLPNVLIDDDPALEQALLSLLENAAEAGKEGLELQAGVDGEAGRCRLDILDRGPGLDEAVASRLGEPFITTKAAEGGMGIGFFLSNATLERLGGRVEIFNRGAEAGGGACTRITLPFRSVA